MAEPALELPAPMDMSSLRGKTFAYVGIFTNSIVQTKYQAFSEALASVGAKAVYFDGKGRPDAIAQGFGSAIAQQAAAIVTDGYDAGALVKQALADATAAGIPVINNNASDPGAAPANGVAGAVAPAVRKMGAVQADYALARTDCQLHAVVLLTSASRMTADVADGFRAEMEDLCPRACEVTSLDYRPGTYPTELTPRLQTTLQRDPRINAVVLSAGDVYAPYAAQAVTAIGRDVPIISGEGSGLTEAIKGNGVVADVLWAPAELLGYLAADTAMRAALGHPASVAAPIRLLDPTNWGTAEAPTPMFPDVSRIKRQLTALWDGQA